MRPSARVALIGFEDQDNLGLRYLSSRLRQFGHQTRILTITDDAATLRDAITRFDPHVVGFSLIFQYLVPQFARLLKSLRELGVEAHFTMGGHYASFEPHALLGAIPELDSVVRFEGEDTLLELTENILRLQRWDTVPGIAYRAERSVMLTAPRVGRANLDELPWPDRDDIAYEHQALPMASVLAGRGCPWRCSFCSIITFYEGNGTKGRRRRDPFRIVDELEHLQRERGVRIILWQDDDFLAGGKSAIRWAHAIANECIRRGLHRTLRWKISCRSDEVRAETLAPLVEAGLTHVYMGVESGDPDNLRNLNKLIKPGAHLRAGQILRQLGVSFDFGFMLLEPWSTFETVRNNLQFLQEFVGDGASPVSLCRTLPYAGTQIESRLRDEGRLEARNLEADYAFLDPRLDVFYDWMLGAFAARNSAAAGAANLLRLLLFEAHLSWPERPRDEVFRECALRLTALSNRAVLNTVASAVEYVEKGEHVRVTDPELRGLATDLAEADDQLRIDLIALSSRQPGVREHVHLMR